MPLDSFESTSHTVKEKDPYDEGDALLTPPEALRLLTDDMTEKIVEGSHRYNPDGLAKAMEIGYNSGLAARPSSSKPKPPTSVNEVRWSASGRANNVLNFSGEPKMSINKLNSGSNLQDTQIGGGEAKATPSSKVAQLQAQVSKKANGIVSGDSSTSSDSSSVNASGKVAALQMKINEKANQVLTAQGSKHSSGGTSPTSVRSIKVEELRNQISQKVVDLLNK